MAVIELFSNLAGTVLAAPISSTSTTLNVQAGTGVTFPQPGVASYFVATLTDALTGLRKEVVKVTARSADAFTIVRAQEGTAAQAWIAGDLVQNLFTAATAQNFIQATQVSSGLANFGISATAFYAGNPNGHIAGSTFQAGTGVPADSCYDTVDQIMYVCTTTGSTTTAVWTPLNYARLAGSLTQQFNVAAATANSQAVNLGQFGTEVFGIFGYVEIPGPGANFIMQWMQYNAPTGQSTPAIPLTFPHAMLGCTISYQAGLPPFFGNVGIQPNGLGQVTVANMIPAALSLAAPGLASGSNFTNIWVWGF